MDQLIQSFATDVDIASTEDKSSFDRFGDDLTELLLSYLSISDKFSFECLSKQIQSLVFTKQKSIIISNNYINITNNSIVNQLLIKSKEYKRLFTIDIDFLAKLVTKLGSVREIIIDNYCIIDGQVLRVIADNCRHLRRFICTSIKCRDLSDEDLHYFGLKMSSTLTSVQFDCLHDIQMNSLLKLMKNSIKTVNIESNNFCLRNDLVFIDTESLKTKSIRLTTSAKMLPKLTTIFITCYSVDDIKRLADCYSDSLKKLRIKFMSNYLMGNVMNGCLQQLSRFVNIRSLTLLLYTYQKGYIAAIDDGLRLIGKNCTKLKHFVCEMTQNLISGQLFCIFSEYSSLKTCKISTTYETLDDYGTVELLKNMKNLRHLTLYLKYLSDKHFVNIHSFLPNLESFKVNTSNGYLSDRTVRHLSKLSRLTTVEISGSSPSLVNISDSGVSALVANSPHIRTLCLFCKTSVGTQTVSQFIETAKRFPKNDYKYYYETNNSFLDHNYPQMDSEFNLLGQLMPTNLQIYPI